jgi:hypothetical protein
LQPIRTALESAVIGDIGTEAARQMRLEWIELFQRRQAAQDYMSHCT